jgi:hypothetical protein
MSGELPPEATFELRILLDRVHRSSERCREALYALSEGRMNRDRYARIVQEQMDDQKVFVERHKQFKIRPDSY